MTTVRLTAAQALVRYASAQLNEDGVPFLAGCWAIFGHGNVAGLGEALHGVRDSFPTWRGHNEQSMAHAAIAYSKQLGRRRAMMVTSSIGPGAANMVTAAALAHVNRIPRAAGAGRRVRQPRARSGAAAARGFRQRRRHGQRLLPAGEPLFRPHHAARAIAHRPAPRHSAP